MDADLDRDALALTETDADPAIDDALAEREPDRLADIEDDGDGDTEREILGDTVADAERDDDGDTEGDILRDAVIVGLMPACEGDRLTELDTDSVLDNEAESEPLTAVADGDLETLPDLERDREALGDTESDVQLSLSASTCAAESAKL